MDNPPNILDQPEPELPGMAEACAEVGLDKTPAGLSKLTKKQREFTLAYLRTGNASEAARIAGYSDPGSDGSKIQKAPEVAAVLAQAALPVAKNADQIVRRVSERARIAHAMVEREMAKADTLRSMKTLREWMDAANKADALLGVLLGKIRELTINHNTTNIGIVNAEDRAHLLELQRNGIVLAPAPVAQGGRN